MSLYANNILQTVTTYNRSGLGMLQNLCCLLHVANKKFKNFNSEVANLGSSVTFDLPPQATTVNGLVAAWQPAVQLTQTLTCDQAANSSYTITNQQQIFNLEKGNGIGEYVEVFSKAFATNLANKIESNLALNANSSVPVMSIDQNGNSVPTGALHTESGPFTFFGDGTTPLNSFNQLAQMLMLFKNWGSVQEGIKVILPDTIIPSIVGTGLNQFAPERNNDIAMSWEVGKFGTPPVEYYASNLLPTQVAGDLGNNGTVLTLVSVNDPTGQNVTQLTFSGAGTDANAVFSGDMFQFLDGVSGFNNVRYLVYYGQAVSSNPVQCRVIANAASSGGNVTVTISQALNWAGGGSQNLNQALQPGMQVKFLPSHKCGLIIGGDSFYVAMPRLPDESPYYSSVETDEETGASTRMTYGSVFGQNQKGFIHSATWGSTVVPRWSRRIVIPLSQS